MSLIRNLAPLIICLLLGLGGAWLYARSYGSEYESTTVLMLRVPRVFEKQTAEKLGDDYRDIEVVLRSPVMIGKAVQRWKLTELPVFRSTSDVVEAIRSGLTVRKLADSRSEFEVRYRSPDPQAAVTVAKALVVEYEELFDDMPKKADQEMLTLISRAEDELERRVANRTKSLAEFQESTARVLKDQTQRNAEFEAGFEREEQAMKKELATSEKLLAEVGKKHAEVRLELAAQQSTFLVVAEPRDVKEVRLHDRSTLLKGGIGGAIFGLLLTIGKIASDRADAARRQD